MIFNPFDITPLQDLALTSQPLSWAQPQLQDNIPLVLTVMVFVVADLLAWHPKGVMRHQLSWLGDTRNARTFEASAIIYPWLKPILLCQYFIFFGLCLLHIIDPLSTQHLTTPTQALILPLAISLSAPLLWYYLQKGLLNWFCYLFNLHNRQIIINRCYQAIHIVLAPISTLIFIGILAGSDSGPSTSFLLAALFILSQIAFIFNGFKIFCINLFAFSLIIVYLCTLEIAPLMVLYAKFVR